MLRNVRFDRTSAPLEQDGVKRAIAAAEAMIADKGRLLIRASGTEPVIRVMAEADDVSLVEAAVATVVDAVQSAA